MWFCRVPYACDFFGIQLLLFQDIQDPFPSTVMETALMGRHPYTKSWQWEKAEDYRIATEALKVGSEKLEVKR